MGIYVYYCESCKNSQEELCSLKSRPDAITCQACGATAHYQVSPGVFVVNGASAANKYSGDSNFKWLGSDDS